MRRSLYSTIRERVSVTKADYRNPKAEGRKPKWAIAGVWRRGLERWWIVLCLGIAGAFRCEPKAVEDYRSPRRFAFSCESRGALASWTAPALWRFGTHSHMQPGGASRAVPNEPTCSVTAGVRGVASSDFGFRPSFGLRDSAFGPPRFASSRLCC